MVARWHLAKALSSNYNNNNFISVSNVFSTVVLIGDTVNKQISSSNWTEWSTIQGVIERAISKSDEREVRGQFEIMSTITP